MLVSLTKIIGLLCLIVIGVVSVLCHPLLAADLSLLGRISPHIALSQNPSPQDLQSFATTKHPVDGALLAPGGDTSPPPKKSMSDQDLYFLALGARFRLSDWLDIGAACTMPFAEEENVGTEDLSIEAMVTMQF